MNISSYSIFFTGILFFLIGQLIRAYRWKFIFSKPHLSGNNLLILYISIGSLVNIFLPFNLGDIFRNYLLKTFSKHSFSDGFSATFIERLNDIIYLFIFLLISSLFTIIKFNIFLPLLFVFLSLTLYLLVKFKATQSFFFRFSCLFSRKIQNFIFDFVWNLILKVKEKNFFTLTYFLSSLFMWGFYFLSYLALAKSFKYFEFTEIITIFHSHFFRTSYELSTNNFQENSILLLPLIPILLSLLYLIIYGIISKINFLNYFVNQIRSVFIVSKQENINFANSLGYEFFLNGYFKSENYLYALLNSRFFNNIDIEQIFEGGSGALTLQCKYANTEQKFVRKISPSNTAEKLFQQYMWLDANNESLHSVKVFNWRRSETFSSYDMSFDVNYIDFKIYIQSQPIKITSQIIFKVLEDTHMFHTSHLNKTKASKHKVEQFVKLKIINNLNIIRNYFSGIINTNAFRINNRDFSFLDDFFGDETFYFRNFYKFNEESLIHGDLTIENILINRNSYDYLLIDPNSENIFNSPLIDYGKLFQSLHSNYEYYNQQCEASIANNNITFDEINSKTLNILKKECESFLVKQYSAEYLKSVYLMEIVNYIRLIPYKIEQKRPIVFFALLCILMRKYKDMYAINK